MVDTAVLGNCSAVLSVTHKRLKVAKRFFTNAKGSQESTRKKIIDRSKHEEKWGDLKYACLHS